MPSYVYRAKDGPTKTVTGELTAESRAAALAMLDARHYTPIWVREKELEDRRRIRLWGRRIAPRDITVFARQLGSLTRSGVPILRALATISEQTENSRLRRVVEDIETTIRDGGMLSGALAKYPSLFSELFVNMVRSGESGGVLDQVLYRMAESREQEEDIRRKIQAAVAYPALIMTVGLVTVVVLLTFFLPRVLDLFSSYDRLPLPTRVLMGASGFFSGNWYWILILLLLAAAIFNRLVTLDKGRTLVDHIKLHVPLLKRLIREADISRFARTLALLLEAGIPIDRSLALSSDTMRNAVYRQEMDKVRAGTVQQGMPLSEGLKRSGIFPVFLANMVGVGEESGHLEESLTEVASFYEKEFDQQTRLATSLLEPALILVVGLVVGFIVAAMLLPIFELGTSL